MSLIPPFFLDAVVSIGVPKPNGTQWVGTGFIVGRLAERVDDTKHSHTFLVTNKHVLAGRPDIVIRFAQVDRGGVRDYPIKLIDDNGPIWIGHPTESVDVATFPINGNFLSNDNMVMQFICLTDHAIGIAEMVELEVSEGDGVFVLGFPMGIVSSQSNYAISRLGAIARVRDVLCAQGEAILIDANIFPGNSGGPVIIRPEVSSIDGTKAVDRAALIGMVKSYVPYTDVAVSQQTGNPRVIFEENSGLALVETVDNIRVVVDLCFDLKSAAPGSTNAQEA